MKDLDHLGPMQQPEVFAGHPALRERGRTRVLAAARTVAVVGAPERRQNLEAHAAAETAAADRMLSRWAHHDVIVREPVVRAPLGGWTAFRAQGTITGMAKLVGINHIALEVGEIDDALRWYGRFFEFRLRGRAGARMAFLDMGDQFIALSAGRAQPPDEARHIGLVVDGKEAVRAELRRAGVEVRASGPLDFSDPWGNHIQVVDYRDIQFTKTPSVLRGMGLDGIGKSDSALSELREKGLSD